MGDILNFNPDRELAFDPQRELGFSPGRALTFDPGRSLAFHPNRDLGFGRRGVVFRGYVCPICGALSSEDATRCDECGTVFDRGDRAAGPSTPGMVPAAPETGRKTPEKTRETARAPAAAPRPTAYCAFCGAKLHPGDRYCWNCGSRSVGDTDVVTLPPQKTERVSREWK